MARTRTLDQAGVRQRGDQFLVQFPGHDQVGGAGLYLLSDLGSGVSGEIHHVDSGYNVVGMVAVDAAQDVAELLSGLKTAGD